MRSRTGVVGALVAFAVSILSISVDAAPGNLDPSFDLDGVATKSLSPYFDGVQGIALQADGKIVAAGAAGLGSRGSSVFTLARYKPDGGLDPSFSGDGIFADGLGGTGGSTFYGVAIQPDGKIVAVGYRPGDVGVLYWVVARFDQNGGLDSSFSNDGVQTLETYGTPASLAIQPDGKIVVVGHSYNINNDSYNRFVVVRYLTDGTLDNSFSSDGIVTTDIGVASEEAYAVAVQTDGKIIAAGHEWYGGFALVRYNSDGSLDTSFSMDGIQTTLIGTASAGRALVLQSNGRIVVGGTSFEGQSSDLALARYLSDGSLDSSFSQDGVQTTDVAPTESIYGLAVDPSGRILVAGTGRTNAERIEVARYAADGSLDPAFSNDGIQTTSIGSQTAGFAVALQADGRIVVGGAAIPGSTGYDFAVLRYFADHSSTPVMTPGVVRANIWYLSDTFTGPANRVFSFGRSTDVKLVGDWDGDGDSTPGVARGNTWYFDNGFDAHTDLATTYGRSTDAKIVGDWDGDGDFTPGVIRGGVWYLSDTFTGPANRVFAFGRSTDVKIAGDWDGDGTTTPGVVRGNVWYLDNGFDGHPDIVTNYGRTTDAKIAGDWDGDGDFTPGVTRGNVWYLSDTLAGPANRVFAFGRSTDLKIAGGWST